MTNPTHTHIAIVLDASGSMGTLKADTIGGVNAFMEEQRKAPGSLVATLTQFGTFVGETAPFDKPLTDETYAINGNTALYDAIGKTITELGVMLAALPEAMRPGQVIMVIVTDGHENASRSYRLDAVKQMVERQRKDYSWRFVFLGADPTAQVVGHSLGVGADASMAYDNSHVGIANLYQTASASVIRSRSSNVDVSFSAEERAANDPSQNPT